MTANPIFLNPVFLILLGVAVGVFSGVMGLGGGAIMIPILVLVLGMTQQQAHGTSLAVMIPPVTLPAVIAYYLSRDPDTGRRNVNVTVALWMAVGVLGGSYFGAKIANSVPKETLKLVFGFVLIYIAAYTVFGKEHLMRTLALSAGLVLIAVLAYGAARWHDARDLAPSTAAASGAPVRVTDVAGS
jgi:uncharacterized membrane protein YfcA